VQPAVGDVLHFLESARAGTLYECHVRWHGSRCIAPEMTMVRFSQKQRAMLLDKLADAANLALGALVFGQFLGDRPFSFGVAAFGLTAWFALLGWALVLGRGGQV
jgi:hypothetical protein